jgi:hypothetical protein
MPKRTDIKSILIIGAGPIVIGQACEFDYSGAQACKALRAEGYRIVLVNSNPATIMTDPGLADATYIEPITPEIVSKIIEKERPDALLPTMGGQTALNTAMKLADMGVLEKFGVEMIGAKRDAIDKAEDRLKFRDAMDKIGLESPRSRLVTSMRATRSTSSACPRSSAPASRWPAPAAASPTTGTSTRRSCPARCAPRRSARRWSRRACSAGRNTRWRSCATAPTTASSCARSRTSTRWGSIRGTRSRWRRR